MTKTRSFSIYLLKQGVDAAAALKEDHSLSTQHTGAALPEGASLYVLDSDPRPPWWKSYFAIDGKLNQTLKGALVFLPVGGRTFAITFGHVYHNLRSLSLIHI